MTGDDNKPQTKTKKRLDLSSAITKNAPKLDRAPVKPARSSMPDLSGSSGIDLPLPISKRTIPAEHVLIDASKCSISKFNKRVQSLLSENDPAVKQLINSIKEVGQRDPILARQLPDKSYEVVYGSRRLFAVNSINKQRKDDGLEPIQIRAWLADVPEGDVKALADSENDDREGISIYERAMWFKKLKAENDWSAEVIASSENVSPSTVKDGLKIADIDIAFIQLLSSPKEVSGTSGLQLAKAIEKAKDNRVKEFLSKHEGMVFAKMADLLKGFKDFTTVKSQGSRDSQKPVLYASEDGKTKAKMTKHRTQEGQYKIDVFDMGDDQLTRLQALLSELAAE